MSQASMNQAQVNLLEQTHQYRQQESHDIVDERADDKFTASCSCGWESQFYWDTDWEAERDHTAHVEQAIRIPQTYRVRTVQVRESWATIKATSPEQAKRIIMAEAGQADPLADDPEFTDVGEYDFPQPIDELAFWIDSIHAKENEDG